MSSRILIEEKRTFQYFYATEIKSFYTAQAVMIRQNRPHLRMEVTAQPNNYFVSSLAFLSFIIADYWD
jgi:hypothetical protein